MTKQIQVRELRREKRTMDFRKEEFEIWFHYYHDSDLGVTYTDTSLDELNYVQLLNQYREKHNLPFPEEIKAIREKYDVSAAKMSDILGFGANTYRQYESGEVPSHANGKLIKMASDPKKFLELVEMCDAIDEEFKIKLQKKLHHLVDGAPIWINVPMGDDPFAIGIMPNRLTGYRKPSLERFANVIIRISEKTKPFKTQLNKLLFYTDFAHYKNHGFSITGCEYSAIQLGPVPNWFETTFDKLARSDYFDIEYKEFDAGNYGVQFKARKDRPFDETLFTEEEIKTIDEVIKKLGKKNSREIIDLSHEETGWIKNNSEKRIIEYDFAFDLKAL
jgi:DNA-binding transcriptional regulator YiaG/uncharacterized phage-associated protein